jgi:hypothetical protein
MKKVLLFFLMLSGGQLFGQIKDFTISLSPNYTLINSVEKKPQIQVVSPTTGFMVTTLNIGTIREYYKSKPGFNLDLDFQALELGSFFLRTGLGVQYIRYQRKIKIENQNLPVVIPGGIDYGSNFGIIYGVYQRDSLGNIVIDPTGQFISRDFELPAQNPNLGKTTAWYIQLPITIGKKFLNGKMTLSTGVYAGFLAHSSVVKEEFSYNSGISTYKDKSSDGFSNALWGSMFECSYLIFKGVDISFNYTHSFTPIYDSANRAIGKTYYNTIALGATYHFSK